MAGRPPYFNTPEELQKKVDEYFISIQDKDNGSGGFTPGEPATITGLILYLGFSHREALIDYEKKEAFSDTVKNARTRVEHEYEKRLFGQQVTGPIFALKNMGWKDKHETALTGADGGPIQVTGMQII